MKYHYKIIFYICIVIYFIFGLSIIYLADLRVSDENWHFAASSLVAQGKLPYRDFAYFHMPLVPYFYGLAMYIFGTSLIAGRLVSFLLGLLTIILIYKTALRLKGEYAGIFAILPVIFNIDIIHNSTFFYWGPLANFLLSLFCFFLASKLKPIIKFSICTALLLLAQGVRYALDYMTVYTLLFVAFAIYINKENRKVIAGIILSYIGASLLVYLPGILIAPKAFLFDTLTHYFLNRFLFTAKGIYANYSFSNYIYDRIKMLLILFRNYYIIKLFLLLIGIYGIWYLFNALKTKKISSFFIQYKVYSILASLVILNEIFYLAIFGQHLTKYPYHIFPAGAILIGCGLTKIFEYFKISNEKIFFTFSVSCAIIFNFFTQDIEGVINSPQYAGVKFLTAVSSAIQRHTKPEDKVFAFMNGYVLHAHRQILPDTVYEVSATSLFPNLSDQEAQEYKLLSPNILLNYFKDKKAKVIVLERPGRLDNLATDISTNYKDGIESILTKDYILLEKVHKYPENIPGPVVYIYRAK